MSRGAGSPGAEAEIAVLVTQLNRLQGALLDRLVSIEASGSWAIDGSPSLRAWLAARTRSTQEVAGEQVRVARSLRAKPLPGPCCCCGRLAQRAAPGSPGPGRRRGCNGTGSADDATLGGEPLPLTALRRLSCDARVTRIVLSPDGQPPDVGHTTRTIHPAVWLAALARDNGCAIRGCNQGPERCEGHHARPYSQGGQTKISNIHLLCTGTNGHHHQIHDHGRTLQLHDGRWIGPAGFTDPPHRPPA